MTAAPALLCATLEVALNRLLGQEPQALAECAALDGRIISLAVESLGWEFHLECHAAGVRVLTELPPHSDVRVRAPLALLLRLALQTARGESALPAGLHIEGDPGLLQRFSRALAVAGFDPEELIAQFTSEATAHRIHQSLRGLFGWGRKAAGTLALDTAEYLREETHDLARASDVTQWMDAVDSLRDDVARLDARIKQMERAA